MAVKEILEVLTASSTCIRDFAVLAIILSLVQVSPLKINPWSWLKRFIDLPDRLENLEKEFNNDRAFRWRSMIVKRSERIQDGFKFRKEVWVDTMETIDNYLKYCEKHPDFRNELANMTIEYLREEYKLAQHNNDFIDGIAGPDYQYATDIDDDDD